MPANAFGLHSQNVATPDGVFEATVLVENGTISGVVPGKAAAVSSNVPIEELGDQVIMPGLVDSHVHVNEPGRTEWEGFTTATRAAAAGGITTIADMPLNCQPVTTTGDALEVKLRETAGKLWVDCAFWGGVVPGNKGELQRLIDSGVAGFKCFLIHSGLDEFANVSEQDLHDAMPILAK